LALLAFPRSSCASGVVTNCAQADLVAALNEGGLVTLDCDGTIALTNEITISREAILDGSGHAITISGNNATRLFSVNPGIKFTLINLTLANGHHRGSEDGARVGLTHLVATVSVEDSLTMEVTSHLFT